jgi:hypothetical protein
MTAFDTSPNPQPLACQWHSQKKRSQLQKQIKKVNDGKEIKKGSLVIAMQHMANQERLSSLPSAWASLTCSKT